MKSIPAMKASLPVILTCLLLTGCAATGPSSTIGGNGSCHPSQDLPAKKTMQKVPEADTQLEDFWALFAKERKDHAVDIKDYNSLYSQCVDKGAGLSASQTPGTPR